MFQEEKTFTFRFSLEANFPDDYEGREDEYAWLHDWEARMKPELLKHIVDLLRQYPSWNVHVRNRGIPSTEEIEIAMEKDFSKTFPL